MVNIISIDHYICSIKHNHSTKQLNKMKKTTALTIALTLAIAVVAVVDNISNKNRGDFYKELYKRQLDEIDAMHDLLRNSEEEVTYYQTELYKAEDSLMSANREMYNVINDLNLAGDELKHRDSIIIAKSKDYKFLQNVSKQHFREIDSLKQKIEEQKQTIADVEKELELSINYAIQLEVSSQTPDFN